MNYTILKPQSKHTIFKNIWSDTPSWKEIFFDLQESVKEGSFIKVLDPFTIITHNVGAHIPIVHTILEALKINYLNLPVSAHMYRGLNSYSTGLGKHKDTMDVFFWQIKGTTKWNISEDNELFTYIVEEGDVIFVPRLVFHEVTSLCPRVGISFGVDYA